MSIQAVGWVLEQDAEQLPGKAKLVLVSIANHADHTDGYCWLKLDTIARESSMPVRSLFRYIGALVRNGYLRKQLRKGDDGKQRATDYWILFNRESAKWDWGARLDGEADEAETQDVENPSATVADGETDLADGSEDEQTPVLADGPSAIGGRCTDEPSKTKPKESSLSAASVPRAYRAPPIPQGVVHPEEPKQPIFVFEGSRAWEAWMRERKRRTGIGTSPTYSKIVDGKRRTGWDFPTLFPPETEEEKRVAEEARGQPSAKKSA